MRFPILTNPHAEMADDSSVVPAAAGRAGLCREAPVPAVPSQGILSLVGPVPARRGCSLPPAPAGPPAAAQVSGCVGDGAAGSSRLSPSCWEAAASVWCTLLHLEFFLFQVIPKNVFIVNFSIFLLFPTHGHIAEPWMDPGVILERGLLAPSA